MDKGFLLLKYNTDITQTHSFTLMFFLFFFLLEVFRDSVYLKVPNMFVDEKLFYTKVDICANSPLTLVAF